MSSLRFLVIAIFEFHLRAVMVVTAFISSSRSSTRLSANIIIWTPSHRWCCWPTFYSSFSWCFTSFYLWNDNWRLVFIVLMLKFCCRLCHWWLFFSLSIFLISFHFFFMLFELIHLFFFFCGSFGELLLKLYRIQRLWWLLRNHHLLLWISMRHFRSTLWSSHLYLRFLMNLF